MEEEAEDENEDVEAEEEEQEGEAADKLRRRRRRRREIRTRMSAPGKFESLLKASSGLSSLHLQVPSKTQKVRSYFQPVTGAGRTATCGT